MFNNTLFARAVLLALRITLRGLVTLFKVVVKRERVRASLPDSFIGSFRASRAYILVFFEVLIILAFPNVFVALERGFPFCTGVFRGRYSY